MYKQILWTLDVVRKVYHESPEIETLRGFVISDTFLCVVRLHDLHCTIFLNESSKDR